MFYNIGQKIGGKFTKLAKYVFPWTVLQLIFCHLLQKNVKIWLLSVRLGTRHQTQAFQGFS